MEKMYECSVETDIADEKKWTEYLNCFEDINLYQTIAYGRYQRGGNNLSHLVIKRNNIPVSICQVRIITVPVVKRGIAYVFWGPLYMNKEVKEGRKIILKKALKALVQEYVTKRKLMLKITSGLIDGVQGEYHHIFRAAGFNKNCSYKNQQTIIIDLCRPFDEIRNNLSVQWRRNLRLADRNNMEAVEGTDNQLFMTFYDIYKQLLAIKKIPQSNEFEKYIRIQKDLPVEHKMHVFICIYQGSPVAGIVISKMGGTGNIMFAASNVQGRRLFASAFIYWKALQWFKESGYKWLDLGGIDPVENPGGYEFKTGMGGKVVKFIGQYESCRNKFSRILVRSGELLKKV